MKATGTIDIRVPESRMVPPTISTTINIADAEIEFVERYGARNSLVLTKRDPQGCIEIKIQLTWQD